MQMTADELFSRYGKLQVRFDSLDAEYDKLLNFFAGIVSGEIARSRVLVNLTDRTFMIVPEGQSPGMPATINGLPKCVIAPSDETNVKYEAKADVLTSESLSTINEALAGSGVKVKDATVLDKASA